VQLLGAIVSKAEAEAMLDEVTNFANPFGKGVTFKVDDGDTDQREIFSKADLRAIFGSPVYAANWRTEGGQGEAAFWLPLIGLLTGMRLNEMAQLRICDLRQDENDDGIWFFDVRRTGGRTTKTASSIRRIPLHPELERMGLLRYRTWLIQQGWRTGLNVAGRKGVGLVKVDQPLSTVAVWHHG
jgi:integrase